MGKAHTVVDGLLDTSDPGIQLVETSLRELEAKCPVNS